MEQDYLKKLKRNELLEIIVRQKKRIEELEKQISDLEHADDKTVRLSVKESGSWSDTLRVIADLFDSGNNRQTKAPTEASIKKEERPTAQSRATEPFDWGWEQPKKAADRMQYIKPVEDASFIELDK